VLLFVTDGRTTVRPEIVFKVVLTFNPTGMMSPAGIAPEPPRAFDVAAAAASCRQMSGLVLFMDVDGLGARGRGVRRRRGRRCYRRGAPAPRAPLELERQLVRARPARTARRVTARRVLSAAPPDVSHHRVTSRLDTQHRTRRPADGPILIRRRSACLPPTHSTGLPSIRFVRHPKDVYEQSRVYAYMR
jgi:hypothetical protein